MAANPFDEYDVAPGPRVTPVVPAAPVTPVAAGMSANPFDEFDIAPIPRATPVVQAAPTAGGMVSSALGDVGNAVQSFGVGSARGVANVGLTAQDWIGQGLSALGGGAVGGDFLQRDARMGQAKLNLEAAPFQERNPYAFGAGKIGGEVLGALPAIRGAAGLVSAKAPGFAQAIRSGGMEAANAFTRAAGGAIAGGVTSLLTEPEDAGMGALVGAAIPVVGAPVIAKIGQKIAEKAVPATQEVEAMAKKLYETMDQSNVRIVQPVVAKFSSLMGNFVGNSQQYLKRSHTVVNEKLAQLKDLAAEPLSVTRMNEFYKDLRQSASNVGGTEGSILYSMADKVKSLFDNITPKELGGASAQDIVNLRRANDLQRRAFKSADIDEILRKATLKAEGETSNVPAATAIQKGFESLAANKGKMASFSAEERKLIEGVAKGTYKTKILNVLSKLKPGMKLDARALVYALGGSANPAAAVALAGTGAAAGAARNVMVKGQAEKVGRFIRNKGPVQPPPFRFPYPVTSTGVATTQEVTPNRMRR